MVLPAQVLRPELRAGGMGVFFTCYYVALWRSFLRRGSPATGSVGKAAKLAPARRRRRYALVRAWSDVVPCGEASETIKRKRRAGSRFVRLHCRGRWQRRAACWPTGSTANGRHRVLLPRSRRRGPQFLDPPADRLRQAVHRRAPQLAVQFQPEPELNGRQIIQPRGKVLGGSSSINGLLYIRGQAEDFNHWRQLGNTGWSFDDVLPYFPPLRGSGAW